MGFFTMSEKIDLISQALLKAQKEMGPAKKDAENPYFKSKYADLGAVLEVCKGPLNNNGIIILQPVVDGHVLTTLLHESGQYISSQTKIISKSVNDPQAQGSAITYARRYGLQALLSIPAEDDDGEGAMVRKQEPQPQGKPQTATTTTQQTPKKEFKTITAKQAGRFYFLGRGVGKSDEEMNNWLQMTYGIKTAFSIKPSDYEEACNWAEKTISPHVDESPIDEEEYSNEQPELLD